MISGVWVVPLGGRVCLFELSFFFSGLVCGERWMNVSAGIWSKVYE